MALTKVQSGLLDGGLTLSDSAPANTLVTTSAGNVGIGTATPAARLESTRSFFSSGLAAVVSSPNLALTNTANFGYPVGMLFRAPLASGGSVINNASIWAEWTGTDNAYLGFATTNSGTLAERMRIDNSGSLLVGTTSAAFASNERVSIAAAGGNAAIGIQTQTGVGLSINMQGQASGTLVRFNSTDAARGTISTNGSTVAYNTSSDYRLKENIAPMTGALAIVDQLKPCTYVWKSTGELSQGFIAHELAEVVPDCVTGEKDAVNEDGSIDPQGIDTSFLVATLTAAIQEQQAIITDLKARIETLEAK
jgi:hypothetical protein